MCIIRVLRVTPEYPIPFVQIHRLNGHESVLRKTDQPYHQISHPGKIQTTSYLSTFSEADSGSK